MRSMLWGSDQNQQWWYFYHSDDASEMTAGQSTFDAYYRPGTCEGQSQHDTGDWNKKRDAALCVS